MKTLYCILAIIVSVSMVGCDNSSRPPKADADEKQQQATADLMAEAERQIGMPAISNFQERKWMKTILELRDRADLVCHAYVITLDGTKVYLGKCIGYGLPYSVQFTNPERVAINSKDYNYGWVWGTMPQPDPNGLFMPEGLSATWLMMIPPDGGDAVPLYVENEIIVSPFPLH